MDEVDFQALIAWANEHRPQRVAELAMLQKMGARLAAALRTKNEVLGVLVFGAPSSRDSYTAVEKRVLGRAADQFALIVENARLTDRVVEQGSFVAMSRWPPKSRGASFPNGLRTQESRPFLP
jgi:GAF domain-containing protein